MTSSNGGPFLFKELEGTSWHKRFAAEEFQIFLDHYPERKIVSDSALTEKETGDKARLEEYHGLLIDYILNNAELNEKMPIEILKDLRGLRFKQFGLYASCPTDDKPLLYDRTDMTLRKKLESKLSQAEKILFFPGKPESFKAELTLLSELTEAEIHIVCSEDPLLCSVTGKMIDDLQKQKNFSSLKKNRALSLPLYSRGIETLKDLQNEGFLVFTTSIWLYLEIFRNMADFGFILNNSEWFSRGLLQHSYEQGEDNLLAFSKSAYTDMHLKFNHHEGMTLAGFQRAPFPSDINVSGVQYTTLSLSSFLREESPRSLKLSMSEKVREFNRGNEVIKASSGLYRIEPDGIFKTDIHDREAVLVSLITTEEQKINAAPIFLNTCTPPEVIKMKETGVFSSFNYYFTDNLVKYYNNRVSEKEKLQIRNFFIDYLSAEINGEWFETLPLYNKALLGCTKKGRIFAGHFLPEKVDLFLEDRQFTFSDNEINPAGDGSSEGIYLPSSERDSVGEGRFCVVIVQNQIIYRGQGPCTVPPVGAVAVVKESIPGRNEAVRFQISWKDMPYSGDDLLWLVGGFNLLVEKGKNVYSTLAEADNSLINEGWKSEASQATQETQLDPKIRQPRAVFGRTKSGQLLLAQFSGRTAASRGATFSETALFIEQIIEARDELDFLINFDGGASASIIGYKKGKYSNFSLTAPSETNPAGVARRLPVYFSLSLKTAKEIDV